MAKVIMDSYNAKKGKIPIGNGRAEDIRGTSFHATVTKTGTGTSDYVLIPDVAHQVLCVLDPNGNTARLEATVGSVDEVDAGTAIWEAWTPGAVGSITSIIYGPVTAVRMVVASGVAESKVQIRASTAN